MNAVSKTFDTVLLKALLEGASGQAKNKVAFSPMPEDWPGQLKFMIFLDEDVKSNTLYRYIVVESLSNDKAPWRFSFIEVSKDPVKDCGDSFGVHGVDQKLVDYVLTYLIHGIKPDVFSNNQ